MAATGLGHNEAPLIREQIDRVVNSELFRHSEALRRLLLYLADKSLSGEANQLKEYTVGLEALGKAETYDPRQDAIVRSQAARLRQKIGEYYRTEGLTDPVVIEFSKGHFRLDFHKRDHGRLDRGLSNLPGVSGRNWFRVCIGLSAVLAVSVALAIFWGISYWRLYSRTAAGAKMWTPEVSAIWEPFLLDSRPILISLGAPLFIRFPGQGFFRSPEISDWDEARRSPVLQTMTKAFQAAGWLEQPAEDGFSSYATHTFTGVGEATSAFQLGALLGTRRANLFLKRSSVVSWEDFSQSNLIFLGPPKFNLQLKDIPINQDFLLTEDGIKNLRPRPGEPTVFFGNWKRRQEQGEDYALISRFPGLLGRGGIVVFAASDSEGTLAAVQYTTESEHAKELLHHLRLPSGKIPPYYQVIIKARFKDMVPLQISYVLHHELKPVGHSKPE